MMDLFEKFKEYQDVPTPIHGKFQCLNCGNYDFSFAHLIRIEHLGSFGPWYCDSCGFGWYGRIKGLRKEDGVSLYLSGDRLYKTLVLLRLKFSDKADNPVHVIVPGMCFANHGDKPDPIGHSKYFYNEHTCPWNWLRIPIAFGDNTDPHGLFEFVDAVLLDTIPTELKSKLECSEKSIHFSNSSWEDWQLLFPALKIKSSNE